MKNLSSFLQNNKTEFLIFTILFISALSITMYQYLSWEVSQERIKWESFALFSGDEPFYLQPASTIVNYFSINTDDFYKSLKHDPNLIFPDLYYNVDSCRTYHAVIGADGHCWPANQPGLSFLFVPGYAIGGVVGAMVTMNIMFATQGIVIFKLSSKFANKNISFLCALIFSLATISLSFSDRPYPDFVAGFFLLSTFYFFFIREKTSINISIVGALLGFLPFLKLAYLVFPLILLPIMIIVLLKKGERKGVIILCDVFVIFILLLVLYLDISQSVQGEAVGFGGSYAHLTADTLSTGVGQSMEYLTKGLGNLLFGRSYGLFVFSPLALLSLFGIKYVWTENKTLAISVILVFSLFVILLSLTIPNAAGWTLPSRYLLPVLPLMIIPLAPLFRNFSKKIIFHICVLITAYVGVSLNILFARIIYAHPTSDMRSNIANQVYFGVAKIFPYVGTNFDNFWSSTGPFFWILIGVIIILFGIFTMMSIIKKTLRQMKTRDKYILISIVIAISIPVFIYVYESVHEYLVELKIIELYHEILHRDPDPDGLVHWKNEVLNNGKSYDWVADVIKNSPEGITITKITTLYKEILHRDPDPDGLVHWKNEVLNNGKSYDWVADMMKNSSEAMNLNK